MSLIEQYQSGDGGIAYHADRVDLYPHRTNEGSGKKEDADDELPEVDARCAEVLLV